MEKITYSIYNVFNNDIKHKDYDVSFNLIKNSILNNQLILYVENNGLNIPNPIKDIDKNQDDVYFIVEINDPIFLKMLNMNYLLKQVNFNIGNLSFSLTDVQGTGNSDGINGAHNSQFEIFAKANNTKLYLKLFFSPNLWSLKEIQNGFFGFGHFNSVFNTNLKTPFSIRQFPFQINQNNLTSQNPYISLESTYRNGTMVTIKSIFTNCLK